MWLYLRDFKDFTAFIKAARIWKSTGVRVFLWIDSDMNVKEF